MSKIVHNLIEAQCAFAELLELWEKTYPDDSLLKLLKSLKKLLDFLVSHVRYIDADFDD